MRRMIFPAFAMITLSASIALYGQDTANAEKGKTIFEEQSCGGCHNVDSDEKKLGPALKGLFKKEKMVNGNPPTDESVLKQIDDGGNGMPSYKELPDQDKKDLIAYLKTI